MCPISTLLPTGTQHGCTWLHGPRTEGIELATVWDGKLLIQQEEKGPGSCDTQEQGQPWEGRDVWDRTGKQFTGEEEPISLPMAASCWEHVGGGKGSPSSQGPAKASSRGRKSVTSKLGGVQTCPVQRTNTLRGPESCQLQLSSWEQREQLTC